jgi:hypothetical protein
MRWRCGDCKGSLDKLRSAPMVHDAIEFGVSRFRVAGLQDHPDDAIETL